MEPLAVIARDSKIGVGITTHNRRALFLDTLRHWLAHLPVGASIVVVDDASDEPLTDIDPRVVVVRHSYRRGVAMSKNACIAALMDAGCDELFLADDDVYPLVDGWWQPYIDSDEPHLSFQWPRRTSGDHRWKIAHNDGTHFSIGFPRGVMLYCTREVIDAVGGMDIAYGAHGGEHVEWQKRIHERGLTTWAFADVCGSDRIWRALDKDQGGVRGSTIPLAQRRELIAANGRLWGKQQPELAPYREGDHNQDWQLGPYIEPSEHYTLLRHTAQVAPSGVAVEFGVGPGESTRILAANMPTIGFDSGLGLPEDWRPEFGKGSFAYGIPTVPNAQIVEGWFDETVPQFDFAGLGHIGLVHLDADLYSSTETALTHIGPHLRSGTFVVFDEWHGYDGADQHEQKAWREFADRTGIGWAVVGHSHEAWSIRIL